MITKQFTVVGLGELLWDLLPEGKQLGGAPANFAYHAKAMGANGYVVSCIGKDDLGQEILDQLEEHGLDLSHVDKDAEHPTGTVTVELDAQGIPSYTIHENVAWDFIPTSPALLELASKTDAVCFGSLAQRLPVSRATIKQFLEATPPDCLRFFDVNLRQAFFSKEIIREGLEVSQVLKINDEELPVVGELLSISGSETDIMDALIEKFSLRVIALTRGDKGSLLYSADDQSDHPGFPPEEIADTVGAGDSFSAATVMGLLEGLKLSVVCENANRLASFVCTQNGAMPILTDELKEKLS